MSEISVQANDRSAWRTAAHYAAIPVNMGLGVTKVALNSVGVVSAVTTGLGVILLVDGIKAPKSLVAQYNPFAEPNCLFGKVIGLPNTPGTAQLQTLIGAVAAVGSVALLGLSRPIITLIDKTQEQLQRV